MRLEAKLERLRAILQGYGRAALAFSGGVDSSLLLRCALDALGVGNVLALFARSELLTAEEIGQALQWPAENGYPRGVELEVIDLSPLGWQSFVRNGKERCYCCKHSIYSLFRERMATRGIACLVDGTNIDDLEADRPGLRAIHELEVRMPLVEAGLGKADVRALSRQLGLTTWHRPAASCLATRIPTGMAITGERLRRVAELEAGMQRFGLTGCRVRLCADRDDTVHVEIRSEDFAALAHADSRQALLRFFNRNGIGKVLLNLAGREEDKGRRWTTRS